MKLGSGMLCVWSIKILPKLLEIEVIGKDKTVIVLLKGCA